MPANTMPANTECQLLIDPPADGAWNMAVDEALLVATAESGQSTLRFYKWLRPTLSLGYFQNYADRDSHSASQDADVVRRLSGGGAILHDRELTYSLFLPASHRFAQETQSLYDAVHEAIITVLDSLLATSSLRAESCQQSPSLATGNEPFLCFKRRAVGDILLPHKSPGGAPKIAGSAQRRQRGVAMQHGSILLGQSTAAPELAGIAEIANVDLSPKELLSRLVDNFSGKLALNLMCGELPPRRQPTPSNCKATNIDRPIGPNAANAAAVFLVLDLALCHD